MKAIGIVRKVDELGRVVLPKELRNVYNIDEGAGMEFFTDGDKIILKKYEPACLFCGEAKEITLFKGKYICSSCIEDLHTSFVKK